MRCAEKKENRARRNAGIALTDDERCLWLETLASIVGAALAGPPLTVLACSALSRAIRGALRAGPGIVFFLTDVPEDEIVRRLQAPQGHFFNPVLLRSQFEALELPADAPGAAIVDCNRPVGATVEDILGRLGAAC
jgi:gluconokinase